MLRSVEHSGAVLEKIIAASLRRAEPGQGPILAWPLACGTSVAKRTSALEFAGGVLRVQVPDAGWRNELRTLAGQYLAIINRYVNDPVERIEFVLPEGSGKSK